MTNFFLKNPWPVLRPNLSKKISVNQEISDENIGTEFVNIRDFFNGLGTGFISFDNFVLKGTSLITSIVTKTANYTVQSTDEVILVDSTSGVVTITLPTAISITGQRFSIKDWKGQSATHNITIATTASQTIDGSSTQVLSINYESLTVVSDGTNWTII